MTASHAALQSVGICRERPAHQPQSAQVAETAPRAHAHALAAVSPGAARRLAVAKPLRADSIRKIVREWVAAVVGVAGRIGGHSLQVGSARVAECCSRPAAGGPPVRRRSTLGREAAARWRRTTGGATGVKACRPVGGSSGRRRRRGSDSSRHDDR